MLVTKIFLQLVHFYDCCSIKPHDFCLCVVSCIKALHKEVNRVISTVCFTFSFFHMSTGLDELNFTTNSYLLLKMYVSLCGCFIWIFYRLLKKTEGKCVPLEYESCSPEHHFTFEATPTNVFLASVQSYSALCTRWLYLLNCALKANAISQGRHLLGSQTPPHVDSVL